MKKVEIANLNLTELVMVDTMHQRKAKMNELSDGVIALPGGFGTLEEFFEMLTWAQLGLHRKPVALLNVDGFYDALLALVDTMVDRGFLRKENREMLLVSDNIEDLLDKMRKYEAPSVGKWLNRAGLLNNDRCRFYNLIISISSGTKIFPEKFSRASAVYFSLRVARVLSMCF